MKEQVKRIAEEYMDRWIELLNSGLEDEEFCRREDQLNMELIGKLNALGLKAEIINDFDCNNYFNAPGYPRAYNFYRCTGTLAVAHDVKNKKTYHIVVSFREAQYPTYTKFSLDYVEVEETPLIDDENTPFTAKLIENIPWMYIRPLWRSNIEDMILEIAQAEYEGRLKEAVEDVKAKLKAGAWIYDYQHMLSALEKTLQEQP